MADDQDNPGGWLPPPLTFLLTLLLGWFWTESHTSPSYRAGWRASSGGRLWEAGWRSRRGSFGQCAAPALR
jgi:hypothetical protein